MRGALYNAGMQTSELVFIAVFLLSALVFAFWLLYRAGRRKARALEKLAADLGLELTGGGPATSLPGLRALFTYPLRVEGAYRGRNVKIFHHNQNTGMGSTVYAAIRVRVRNPEKLALRVFRKSWAARTGTVSGLRDVDTGDADFDKTFVVRTRQERFARTILVPEIRERFVQCWDKGARTAVELREHELGYDEMGSIHTSKQGERFAALLELLCDLAEAVEVYSAHGRKGAHLQEEA